MATEYTSLTKMIRNAESADQANRAVDIACKVYNLGLLTANQLARIDSLAMDKVISFEDEQPYISTANAIHELS